MWKTGATLALLGLIMAAAACEKTGTTGLGLATQPRTLQAVSMLVNQGQAPDTVDLVSEGAEFVLTLDPADSTFQSTMDFRSVHFMVSGDYSIGADSISFSDDPFYDDSFQQARTFSYAELGDQVILDPVYGVFDVDDNGFQDAVSMRVVLEPQ